MGAETRLPTLGLCMIVKDEAAVIDRCLASVRDLVDHWIVCDTGSRDGTPERVEAALAGVPGELHHHAWVDFGHNRSQAIALAAGKTDWILLLDADMVVAADPALDLAELDADGYLLRYAGELDYRQVMLVRGDVPWRFVGATHEYLHADQPYTVGRLDTLVLHHLADGANRGEKLARDRALLEARLAAAPDDSRARFYLGQTYADLGRWDDAVACYERRATEGGWEEESWCAAYRAALARHARGDDWATVEHALLAAYELRPARLEPLYVVARHHREAGAHHRGHLVSRPIVDATYPEDVLFVEREVYRYLLAFEHAICCYWVGDHAAAIRINNGLLELPDLPPDHVDAVIRNRRFSLDALAPPPVTETERRRPRLVVVVPFFNPGCFLTDCAGSILAQEGAEFRVIFVDDGSTDGAGAGLPEGDSRTARLRNPSRRGPAACVEQALAAGLAEDEVVVVVDGEDRLASPDVLAILAGTYAATGCLVTWGQWMHPDGRRGGAKPFPDAAAFARAGELGHLGPPLTFSAEVYRRWQAARPLPEAADSSPHGCPCRGLETVLGPALLALAGPARAAFLDDRLYICQRARWPEAESP